MNTLNNIKNKIKITQIKSTIGCIPKHKAIMIGLGLKGIGCTVIRENNSSIRGMLNIVKYMIKIEIGV